MATTARPAAVVTVHLVAVARTAAAVPTAVGAEAIPAAATVVVSSS
ncbi:MAG: hypothetical protein WAJ86_08575 [Candidatus Acidiferrales bacterium]